MKKQDEASQSVDPQTTTVIVRITKVVASDYEQYDFPVALQRYSVAVLNADTSFEFQDGSITIEFLVSATFNPAHISKIPTTSDEFQDVLSVADGMRKDIHLLMRARIRSEFSVHSDGQLLPAATLPRLGEDFFRKLIAEAFATTRGYVCALVRDSPIEHLILPLADPDDFLNGTIKEVLESGSLPVQS